LEVVDTQMWVNSDKKLLRRILQNFLTNAFRYAPCGRVVLGCRRQGKDVWIQVWDNGQGIPPDKVEIIFEEFSRLDHSRTAKENGLGLGLAIAKGMASVLEHGITVHSELGKGSVFSIRVPRIRQLLPAATVVGRQPTEQMPLPEFQGMRILCVDNEVSILDALQALLSRWGCEVRLAEDLHQVQALLQSGWQPQVILTDYHLAENLSGLDVLRHINALSPVRCGAVLSADRSQQVLTAVQQAGYPFLAKPLKPLKLRLLLNSFYQQSFHQSSDPR
ncbi:MAG: hybrid sensor histidine kinase/response regulator, partial [Plesiomonas shigelloides]